jgi:tRNA dimethylallyltransferase
LSITPSGDSLDYSRAAGVSHAYPLLAVVGPTGAGKSALALRLAAQFRGEIVNCDSVQVYRGLDIGSAKTPVAQRLGIPHHLLDVVSADGDLTAGTYARMAVEVLNAIRSRGSLPVVVGGTGFYLRALIDGLSPAPPRDSELRVRLTAIAARRPAALHRLLRQRDAAAAGRIHPNDHQKIMRAIETAGRVTAPRQTLEGFRVLKIGLNPDRERLYSKLNQRSAWMFENGLLAETQALLEAGASPGAKALGTLGYKQAVRALTQCLSLEEAVADCRIRTRNYAKRQLTWFRKEPAVHWLYGFGDEVRLQEEAALFVHAFLG